MPPPNVAPQAKTDPAATDAAAPEPTDGAPPEVGSAAPREAKGGNVPLPPSAAKADDRPKGAAGFGAPYGDRGHAPFKSTEALPSDAAERGDATRSTASRTGAGGFARRQTLQPFDSQWLPEELKSAIAGDPSAQAPGDRIGSGFGGGGGLRGQGEKPNETEKGEFAQNSAGGKQRDPAPAKDAAQGDVSPSPAASAKEAARSIAGATRRAKNAPQTPQDSPERIQVLFILRVAPPQPSLQDAPVVPAPASPAPARP
jgi:hypothetical protein